MNSKSEFMRSRVKVPVPETVQQAPVTLNKSVNMVTKWLPFIAAGTAVGVSILALKELKKIKNEIGVLKTQQLNPVKTDPMLSKKMDAFEIQLKKINEFLMNNNHKNPNIIKSVLKNEVPEQPNIINDQDVEDVEYEEVEVTDDEESGDEN
jgi:hypothetical protein